MADTVVALPYLSSQYAIPEATLSNLIQAPTTDLVNELLQSLTKKAHEFDELKSDKLRLEVELENAVRTNESKIKVLKTTVEKGHAEVADLRKKLHESENIRSALESEISVLKSSTTSNQTEFASLTSRISTLESEKRETLALLELKTAAHDELAEELSAQHKKTIELRRELSTAEQNLQAANSAAASARFREQNLQQEVDLTKKNNEWFETELKAKAAEYTKFRKEKSARIAELQRENEEAANTIDTLRRSENTLKARLDSSEQRYEESLASISQLKEAAIQTEETLRIELETASRLAKLQESSANSAKQRAQECQIALEHAKNEAAEEISRLRVEIETEHADKEAAETRVSELEATVAQLEQRSHNVSASPAHSTNGVGPATPTRPGTPGSTFSPRMSRAKGNMTFTQMYTEYDKMRTQLSAEQKTNQELRSALDEMVLELESSKPEIDNLRSDHQRLEDAVMDLSGLLETASKERDDAVKEARKWMGQVEGQTRESDILRQQLRDLSAQLKFQVLQLALTQHGEDYDAEELEKIARGEIEESAAELSPTGIFISRNLVAFKDLHDLQEQNVTLRRMLRELGDKMEGEEARAKDAVRQQEVEELKELRIRVQTYRDEIANLISQSKSYVKERDTFRSLLNHRRQTVGGDTTFSQSVPPGSAPPGAFDSQAKDTTDYGELLRKLQAHYDTFREESLADHSSLRQQVNELSRKNSELMSEISRSNSQLAAASQRAELLQANFDMLKNENGGLQNRYSTLLENASKLELRAQQAAEDLVEAKGLVESLQRENSNLKAEKDLWKSIEKRLIDDIESLRNERGRLDSLNANLQTLLNEREHADSDSRRRLQSNVETLEAELQSTKRKLHDEMEGAKQAALRRDYDQEQSQKRINDLVTSLGAVREELVATKTTKDHLQARVDELTVELKSAEERLQVIQSRPGLSASSAERSTPTEEAADGSGLTREQELLIEISELKRDLDLAKGELAHAKEQVEEYRAISQSTEERMEAEADTHAQYREETDRLIEDKNKKIQDLESRIEEISSELSTTNTEISKLRDEQSEATRHLEEQKANLESEITRLKDDNERYVAAAQCHQDDLKAQSDISQNLQRNYEAELIKHAEAAKNVQAVRAEANQLKLDMAELRTQAETYKKDLAQKEESWAEQRARYEGEVTELQKRREEVNHQNSLLHSQLEAITAQIAALKRDRADVPESDEQSDSQAAPDLEGLQEVIKYLRREKEIVEVQYHLSTQEAKRLRQQFEHAQSQLDETRLKLEQQRRTAADNEHHNLSHNKLMETLNELNLFRESSVTLRNQVKETEAALAERSARVDELTQQIQPLETKIRELEGIIEAKDGELQLLQADRDHYQKRVQNILQKYDRVDPQEMEALNEKLTTLQKERDEAISARDTLQAEAAEKLQAAEQAAETRLTDLRQRLADQFKARSRDLSSKINTLKQEKDVLEGELANTKAELEIAKAKVSEVPAASTVADETAPVNATPASQFPTTTTTVVSAGDEHKIKELEAKIERLEAALAEKEAMIATKDSEMEARVKERADKLKDSYNSKLAEIRAGHRQELEKLSSGEVPVTATPVANAEQTPTTPSKALSDLSDLTDQQVRELLQKNETLRTIVRNNIRTKVIQAEEKLKEEAQQVSKAHEEALAALKKAQEEETAEKVKAAVQLSDKKTAARISMLDTRLKTSLVKIEIVSKAADETPQKPVIEVWEVAKSARPPAAAPKAPAGTPPVPVASPAQASPAAPSPAPVQQQAAQPVPVSEGVTPEAPVPGPEQTQPGEGQARATTTPANPFGQAQSASQPQQQQQQQQQQQPSSLPSKPPSGTAPGMLRALQSGLPVARGGRGGRGGGPQNPFGHAQPQQAEQQQTQGQTQSQRGTGLPRGRGGRGGQGRGGNQNTGGAQNQSPASPVASRGGLNVQARQFTPQGNKRSREDGADESATGGATGGKRMRGGGGPARGGASS